MNYRPIDISTEVGGDLGFNGFFSPVQSECCECEHVKSPETYKEMIKYLMRLSCVYIERLEISGETETCRCPLTFDVYPRCN
jgi:hypothetical protein